MKAAGAHKCRQGTEEGGDFLAKVRGALVGEERAAAAKDAWAFKTPLAGLHRLASPLAHYRVQPSPTKTSLWKRTLIPLLEMATLRVYWFTGKEPGTT